MKIVYDVINKTNFNLVNNLEYLNKYNFKLENISENKKRVYNAKSCHKILTAAGYKFDNYLVIINKNDINYYIIIDYSGKVLYKKDNLLDLDIDIIDKFINIYKIDFICVNGDIYEDLKNIPGNPVVEDFGFLPEVFNFRTEDFKLDYLEKFGGLPAICFKNIKIIGEDFIRNSSWINSYNNEFLYVSENELSYINNLKDINIEFNDKNFDNIVNLLEGFLITIKKNCDCKDAVFLQCINQINMKNNKDNKILSEVKVIKRINDKIEKTKNTSWSSYLYKLFFNFLKK
jgi:hypothetical protein